MIRAYAIVNIAIISGAGALFIGLFLLLSRKNIALPIKKPVESAVGFADHSYHRRDVDALSFEAPSMSANNEIKSLCDAAVKMTENTRDYVSDIINAEHGAQKTQELANLDALTGVRNKTACDNIMSL